MNSPETIIIGAHGQLGRALQERFPQATAVDRDELDISNSEAVAAYDWSGTKFILNAAAYTSVDLAETSEGRLSAWQANASAVSNLARVALQRDATLVHVSSEYVFDGTKNPHTESEPLSPLSVYGASKAAGDIAASLAPKHYIVRTSWVIGEGKNFVRTMMDLSERNISPTVVADQIGRLTFTEMLVDAIAHLLETNAAAGTYNVSNGGEPASWADVTREIFRLLGRTDLTVTDTTTAEYFAGKSGIAPRPLQSTLDLSKIQATGLALRDWRGDLAGYIKKQKEAQA